MGTEYRVNVYECEFGGGEIISRVRYNASLDYWDGRNWSNGGTGMHKGITKLKDGRYVIIIGSNWQGDKDYGYIVSADEALQEILRSQSTELLETKKFKELKEMYDEMNNQEEEDEEEE